MIPALRTIGSHRTDIPPVSGFFANYDARGGANLVRSGDSVDAWNDRSSNATHLSTPSTNRPVYDEEAFGGRGGVLFTSASQNHLTTGAFTTYTGNVVTVYLVMSMPSSIAVQRIFGASSSPTTLESNSPQRATLIYKNTSTNIAQLRAQRNNSTLGETNFTFGVPFVATSIFTGSNNVLYTNSTTGLSVASSGNFSYSYYRLGASFASTPGEHLNATIGQSIVYHGAHNATQRSSTWNWLYSRWGITP